MSEGKPNDPSIAMVSFILLIAAYLSLNSTLNLLNKWALGHYGLSYPLMLTSTHMAFSFIVLSPFALRMGWDTHVKTLQKQWKGILYIGAFMALNIALNNLSLLDISLSLNQIIRSAIPVVTCTLAIIVEGKIPTRQEATALIILTSGVMMAVWQGSVTGKPYAIALCVVGTICNGAMMTFSGKVLSEKLDVVRLTFYTAPVSLTCLAPFYMIYERQRFMEYFSTNHSGVLIIMIVSSINAVCYNLIHSLMIKKTSAVTTTVLGEIKIVGLLVLSALLLGESKEFTFKMTIGCAMAMSGFFLYSQTKISALRSGVTSSTGVNAKVISLDANSVHNNSSSSSDSAPLLKIHKEGRSSASQRSLVDIGSQTTLQRSSSNV